MLTKFGGVVDTVGSMTATTTIHGKSLLGVFHVAVFAKSSLKSGAAEAEAVVPAAVCTEPMAILVSIISLPFVLQT
jgi:hypothetical protein